MHERFETPGPVRVVVENECGLVSVECVAAGETQVRVEGEGQAAELAETNSVSCTPDGRLVRVQVPRRRLGRRSIGNVGVAITALLGAGLDLPGDAPRHERLHRAGRGGGGPPGCDGQGGHHPRGGVGGDLSPVGFGWHRGRLGGPGRPAVDVVLRRLVGDAGVSTVSGRVEMAHCASGSIRVESVSGSVSVGVPPGVALRVDADSVSGRVSSEIPIAEEEPPTARPSLAVTVATLSGDISLRRAAEPARMA